MLQNRVLEIMIVGPGKTIKSEDDSGIHYEIYNPYEVSIQVQVYIQYDDMENVHI